jgi:hypothetical protein
MREEMLQDQTMRKGLGPDNARCNASDQLLAFARGRLAKKCGSCT